MKTRTRHSETVVCWIDANERLPTDSEKDKYGFVLVTFGGDSDPVVRLAKRCGDHWVDPSHYIIHSVRHWAAMPSPAGRFTGNGLQESTSSE